MGFWVKNQNENKYLYLRYSEYKRDKRTLKRLPKAQGDGSSNSNKYIKRKDLYLGKLVTLQKPKKIFFFEDYIKNFGAENKNKFLLENTYEKIFDTYLDYLFKLYNINKKSFFINTKHIVYETSNGYLSKRILDWVHSFKVKPNQAHDEKEIERFVARCEFIGILDLDIITALYQKICPKIEQTDVYNSINKEIKDLGNIKSEKKIYKDMKDFLKHQ